MKRFLCVCLSVVLVLCLVACDNGTSQSDKKPDFTATGVNQIKGVAEFEILRMFQTKDVIPPKPASFYTHYEADDGFVYAVIVMNVKNLSEDEKVLNDLFELTAKADGESYTAEPMGVIDGGTYLSSYHAVAPLSTARAYYLLEVPEHTDLTALSITIKAGKVSLKGKLNIEDYADAVKTVKKGDVLTDGETVEATLQDVYTTDALYPPNKSGYYHYFEADSGKVYLVMEFTVKNLDGADLIYDDIAGVSCVYNEKYRYSGMTVFSEDGGQDLSSYSNIYSLVPLESNTVYYLMELPEEAENGPVEISIYMADQDYRYLIG